MTGAEIAVITRPEFSADLRPLEIAEQFAVAGIETEEQLADANANLSLLKKLRAAVVEGHKDMKGKAHGAHKAVCVAEKSHLDPIDAAIDANKRPMIVYEREERRKVEEERQRIAAEEQARLDAEAEAEAARQEVEAEKARAEAKRKQAEADELAKAGQAKEAEAARKEAERKQAEADERDREANRVLEAQANAPAPVAPPPPKRVDGPAFVERHKARVIDSGKFYRALAENEHLWHLAPVSEGALNRQAQQTKGLTPIAGVEFYKDTSVRAS